MYGGGAGRADDNVKTGERLDLEALPKLFDLIENAAERSARRCSVFCGYVYVPGRPRDVNKLIFWAVIGGGKDGVRWKGCTVAYIRALLAEEPNLAPLSTYTVD